MSVYVLGYNFVELDPMDRSRENIEVDYVGTPEWRIPTAHLVGVELGLLERMGVHVGEHRCEFAVEALPEGDFAIICTTHPPGLKLSPAAE